MDEHAVAAVDLGRPGHLAFDRDDALALLAERFGHELFQPAAEARKAWRRNQRRLVAPLQRKLAEQHTKLERRNFRDRSAAQRCAISRARSSSSSGFAPSSAAGTSPKLDSAE